MYMKKCMCLSVELTEFLSSDSHLEPAFQMEKQSITFTLKRPTYMLPQSPLPSQVYPAF